MQNMEYKWIVPFTLLAFILALVNCDKPSFDGKNLPYVFRRPYVWNSYPSCNTKKSRCCILMKEGEGICCNGNVSQNIQNTQFDRMSLYDRARKTYKSSSWSKEKIINPK